MEAGICAMSRRAGVLCGGFGAIPGAFGFFVCRVSASAFQFDNFCAMRGVLVFAVASA
ncbi:hypothetical protein PCAR4_480001 [Paraburkholderia caribensis]|nr:hypothetical protein PCAR4_480001 [Paraburkholderia caribensis]